MSRPPLGPVILLHRTWQDRTACMFCGAEMPWASMEPCPGQVQHGQEVTALVSEVRRLRAELAASLPARVTLPNGTVAEIIAVQARYTLPTGGSWHESMSAATWRRQGNVREELLCDRKSPV